MKKHITPDNFLLVTMVLTTWVSVCVVYNLRTAGLILAVVQVLLAVFCITFVLTESGRERRRLKENLARLEAEAKQQGVIF